MPRLGQLKMPWHFLFDGVKEKESFEKIHAHHIYASWPA